MRQTITRLGLSLFLTLSAAIGAPITMNAEGVRLAPYYDSVGVKTWCAGETEKGYKEKFTLDECKILFNIRYGYFSMRTALMYNDTARSMVTPEMHAAMTDMSYNLGLNTVRNSSMIRMLNEGRPADACAAILKYKFARGHDCSTPGDKTCPGVWTRRKKINSLCLKGI